MQCMKCNMSRGLPLSSFYFPAPSDIAARLLHLPSTVLSTPSAFDAGSLFGMLLINFQDAQLEFEHSQKFRKNTQYSLSMVKAAYRKKVWHSHPDLFLGHEKCDAESKFKLISEAYTCLQSCKSLVLIQIEIVGICVYRGLQAPMKAGKLAIQELPEVELQVYMEVEENHALIGVPFMSIILGTAALEELNGTRAYRKQKESYPSHNPFLP
ncbi:hypothetical protein Vadar_006246 [Vaccinium darrowii]|uniref:Uncharacterized protein n=1 Tax=Vaccinium darrowii TaxID=229202 RepID=A0ACB7YT39_9ERIC|nr:hypothetical protein Vadar_006246 [Vaccinium darrowii]